MVPFAGWVTVTLYFVFGVGLDGLGLGFPCSGFSGGGLSGFGAGFVNGASYFKWAYDGDAAAVKK